MKGRAISIISICLLISSSGLASPETPVSFAIAWVGDPVVSDEDHDFFNISISFPYSIEVYNPYDRAIEITYYSEQTPEGSFFTELMNDTFTVSFTVITMDWIVNKTFSPGITKVNQSITFFSNATNLPFGNYTFSNPTHSYYVQEQAYITDNYAYKVIVNGSGIFHLPPRLPDNWGEIVASFPAETTEQTLGLATASIMISTLVLVSKKPKTKKSDN